MLTPMYALTSLNPWRHDLMQKASHGDATAVAFTHAALWFLGKQMGEMQTVYHAWLQMSFCGQCTLLWKWFGQWKREEKYNKDKNGKWESFLFSFFLSPSVVCNRRDGNWSPGELFCVPLSLRETIPPTPHPHCRGLCDSQAVLCCLSSKKDCFNWPFQYSGLFPWLFCLKPSRSALSTTCLLGSWFPDR